LWQQLILPLNNTILFYMPYAFCRYSSFSIITALVAVYNGNMPPELLYIFLSHQRQQLRNQITGNIRRYKPGRRERVNQILLAHFKWQAI